MELGGYADRVARVDLTYGAVTYEGINEEDARKYIGGRGLGVKYVFDNGPTVDPLSPNNLLCFMLGPLSGTDVTMSGRMAIVTKSPLTGTVTDSHQGGWSGARLRWAGFDGVLFKGRSEKPVYAYIENGKVELRDASDLWGKGVHATVTLLADVVVATSLGGAIAGNGEAQGISYARIGLSQSAWFAHRTQSGAKVIGSYSRSSGSPRAVKERPVGFPAASVCAMIPSVTLTRSTPVRKRN